MKLVRIVGAACLLAVLSGCYQAHVAVIDDGVPVPFGGIAACQIGEKPFRFDLTHPERTASGGTVYRLGNETLAFKPLTDTLYLTQLNSSGLYRYGYVLRNGETLEVLALNQDIQTDPMVRPSAANVLFKPAPNGWQENGWRAGRPQSFPDRREARHDAQRRTVARFVRPCLRMPC